MRKPTILVPTRSDTNRSVQSQKQARSLIFRICEEEELYYPCSENKGADQLCSYCTADLYLCFRLCELLVFSFGGSNTSLSKDFPIFTAQHDKDIKQVIFSIFSSVSSFSLQLNLYVYLQKCKSHRQVLNNRYFPNRLSCQSCISVW